MKNLLIFQQVLMHYRVPFLNQVADQLQIPVSLVTHSIGPNLTPSDFRFQLIEIPCKKFGPFRYANNLKAIQQSFSAQILPFDIHEVVTFGSTLKPGMPLILWGHSHGSRRIFRPVRRWMAMRSNAVVVYTQNGKEMLTREGVDPGRIFVANNTVDVPNAEFNSSIERTSFLFSGRLTSRKKIDEAIIAFARISKAISANICFEIVGEGPERARLEHLASELNIANRVQFHGAIYDSESLKQVFQRSLAYVSPGHVGLGVLHSFAYGVPPLTRKLANHAPEFQHIRDGKNGLLFDGSIENLASIMKRLASDSLSTSIGKNGYDYYLSNCTMENAVGGMIDAISFVMSQRDRA